MKRLLRVVVKLYPRKWRDHYGGEFEALLDDTGVNGRVVLDVLSGALLMQLQQWQKIGSAVLIAMSALLLASSWAAQHPRITPGRHQVFRMDSNVGAMVGFMIFLFATTVGVPALVGCINNRSFHGGAARVLRICIAGISVYLAGVVLISLLTPRTVVSIGDGYCWDLWCLGVERVNRTPQGENILYTIDVRIFSDGNSVLSSPPKDFLYAIDDQGRRFSVLQTSSALSLAEVTVYPKQTVKTCFSFLAPANATGLYLTGDQLAPPWVYLYLGSDLSPFHRRTLLRLW